jgi:hypothetical protein
LTVLVGVRCSDGVVIGTDSAATSSAGQIPLLRLSTDKIAIVDGRVIVAGTGQIGLGQRFTEIIRKAHSEKKFQLPKVELGRYIASAANSDFASTGATKGSYGALLGAPVAHTGELIEFAVSDMQPEIKDKNLSFVAMGSGQLLAEPFISFVSRVFWRGAIPDVVTAKFGVFWALSHAISCAPGGIGEPIAMATLTSQKSGWEAKLLDQEALQELQQHVQEFERELAPLRLRILEQGRPEAIPVLAASS